MAGRKKVARHFLQTGKKIIDNEIVFKDNPFLFWNMNYFDHKWLEKYKYKQYKNKWSKYMKKDLSIIVPFVGEYPQVMFTLQSIAQNFSGKVDFEVIAVNNYCNEVQQQSKNIINDIVEDIINRGDNINFDCICAINKKIQNSYEDKSGEAVKACAKGNDWLKYIEYNQRLSHWQAKRIGVDNSCGKTLLFLDAHVIPSFNSIEKMYFKYIQYYQHMGTMHFPLTYKILEWRKLIYKMHIENNYFYSYKFTSFKDLEEPYEVPCMSTCGMMISRDIYDKIGGWPVGLGIYGGGENFMNYTLAVCGYKKFIYPEVVLFHHGEKRDYHYIYDDFVMNRLISHYLFGGEKLLKNLANIVKGNKDVISSMVDVVITLHKEHRDKIKEIQKTTIEDWAKEQK